MIGGPFSVVYAMNSQPKQEEPPPVRFHMLRAGVTEFVTEDGIQVQVRVKIKSIRRLPDGGSVPYAIEADVVPSAEPALTAEPYDGPNFAQAYAPVGKRGN